MSAAIVFLCITVDGAGQEVSVTKMGKWNGEFSINAGSSLERQDEDMRETNPFFTNMEGGASAKVGYTSGRFYVNGVVSGVSNSKNTANTNFSGDVKSGVQAVDTVVSNLENSTVLTRSLKFNGGLNAGWKFDEHNRLDLSYNFDITNDAPRKIVTSVFAYVRADGIINLQEDIKNLKFSAEDSDNRKSGHNFSIKYLHNFEKTGRVLEASAKAGIKVSENSTDYSYHSIGEKLVILDTTYYNHTNVYKDDDLNLLVKYTDRKFVNVQGLDLDLFFKMDFKADIDDLRKSNIIDSVTREVTKVESYHNHEYKPSPGFRLAYSAGKFSADLAYSPQFFFYSVFNSSTPGRLVTGSTAHFIDIKGSYKPCTGHTFDLICKREETRPDYLQLSTIERLGSSSNEIIVGNPELMPAVKNKLTILYNYGHGRFSSTFETGVMHEKRKICQLISYRDETRVRSWHNAEDGYTANAKFSLLWKGSVIRGDMSANLNYFYGKKENQDDVRTSDWSCKGSVSYLLKTWTFNAELNYKSKITRQSFSMTEIIGLNLKVEKTIGRFSIFLEGKNLLDRKIEVFTESEDGLHGCLENVDNNNRLLLLGLKYKF